jgi:hypothetical protein
VSNKQFLELGMKPVMLGGAKIRELFDSVSKHSDRLDKRYVLTDSNWH